MATSAMEAEVPGREGRGPAALAGERLGELAFARLAAGQARLGDELTGLEHAGVDGRQDRWPVR